MRWILACHFPAVVLLLAGRPWWAFAALFAGHMILLAGTLIPGTRIFGPVQRRADSFGARPTVWLTFDDGPDPDTTPAVLEHLRRHDAKATFFLIGERAARHPDLVRAIADAGHGIANHTHSHPAGRFWRLGPRAIRREIADCQAVLARLGIHAVDFRPPAGMHNPFVQPALGALGLKLVGWSIRGFDGVPRPVDAILRRLGRGLEAGAIILVHDARPTTAEVTGRLLALLRERGLTASLPRPTAAPSS